MDRPVAALGAVDPVAAALVAGCPLVLAVVGGPVGGVVGVVAAVVWVGGPVYGFAAAQFGLLLVVEAPADPLQLAALQVGAGTLLVAGLRSGADSWRVTVAFVALSGVLGGGVGVALDAGVAPIVVGAVLVGFVAVAGYLIHRYELLALGLVGVESDAERG